jgi:oxalate decarboxylase/phosphoglucose isomerase-like protein (cupin superfamily)
MFSSKLMTNGEYRHKLTHRYDESAYIRTESGEQGAWQNSHYHKGVRETYIVQSGWMAFAVVGISGKYHVDIYRPSELITSSLLQHHNVYLPAGAVIHTVKHGSPVGNPDKKWNDWYPAHSDFDTWTKGLDEQDILLFDGEM